MAVEIDTFISYARLDRDFAKTLARELIDAGFTVFFDEASLAVGESFAQSLVDAVRRARTTLIVMSPEYFASQWTRSELEVAFAAELDAGPATRSRIIPLLRRDCEIPSFLSDRKYADCRTDAAFRNAFPGIVDALRAHTAPNAAPVSGAGAVVQGAGASALGIGAVKIGGDIIVHVPAQDELRVQLEDLRRRVDAFSDPKTSKLAATSADTPEPRLCFVAMPFGSEELNDIYEYFVKPSIQDKCGLACERGDDVFGSNVIMEDIREAIGRARLVLADLTGKNPNVFYEVGIAHTLDKEVLLLSQSVEDVPFDLRHRRVLVYANTPKGCRQLEHRIVENINAMLAR